METESMTQEAITRAAEETGELDRLHDLAWSTYVMDRLLTGEEKAFLEESMTRLAQGVGRRRSGQGRRLAETELAQLGFGFGRAFDRGVAFGR